MDAPPLILSVIIPARNEEDCVGECLRSLVAQEEDGWRLGSEWEIIVVNDASTDRTREIAAGFAGVTVMDAPRLEKGWTGKANACWAGAQRARGKWLLFTDADTVHGPAEAAMGVTGTPNTLRLAMIEAERHGAGMLSYSPRQIVRGLAQRALMPLIFSDLAVTYSPAKVNDPARLVAAANGQFLLVRRDVYDRIGGHAAVKGSILEDVELAFAGEARKLGLRFRYAPEAVAARMYRSFGAMVEGWTKNLALLFGNAPMLAGMRLLELAVLVGVPALIWFFWWLRIGGSRERARECWERRWRRRRWCWCGCGRCGDCMGGWRSRNFRWRCGAGAAGDSAVRGVAVAELVSRDGAEAGSLEGQKAGSRE